MEDFFGFFLVVLDFDLYSCEINCKKRREKYLILLGILFPVAKLDQTEWSCY